MIQEPREENQTDRIDVFKLCRNKEIRECLLCKAYEPQWMAKVRSRVLREPEVAK